MHDSLQLRLPATATAASSLTLLDLQDRAVRRWALAHTAEVALHELAPGGYLLMAGTVQRHLAVE